MSRGRITKTEAKKLGQFFNINYHVVPFEQFWYGLNVELEHGLRDPQTNVTNDDLLLTAKITLAHLKEFPNYYQKLRLMEEQLEQEWKRKGKIPSIFN
ncbi:MAG: DUF5661 family protein [candidate division WOR-3 bacterium]